MQDAGQEDPAPPEDVPRPTAEQQQTAEGEGVGTDHPGEVGGGEAERRLDVGQRDGHDRRVEYDHELARRDDGEGDAGLDAALDQLGTVGWNGLTMEGVAAGAQTGKAAVYRRWPTKEDLVADALKRALPALDRAPDLGDVRADLLALCRQLRDTMYSRPGSAVRAVLHECDMSTAERFHRVITEGGSARPSN